MQRVLYDTKYSLSRYEERGFRGEEFNAFCQRRSVELGDKGRRLYRSDSGTRLLGGGDARRWADGGKDGS